MGVRSEYQKHFKVSSLRKSLPHYYENVAFRTARRDREYSHTPLSWYEEETVSVASDDSSDGETGRQSSPVEVMSSSATDIGANIDKEPIKTETVTIGKLIDEEATQDRDPRSATCAEVADEEDSQVHSPGPSIKTKKSVSKVKETKSNFKKPSRPDRKKKIPFSCSTSKPSCIESKIVHHPAPFVSYGWADVERDLCVHKTFNVKATTDVHPAAKRASSRQKESARERRSLSAKKTQGDRLKAMLEAAALEKQKQELEWKSEYQKNFRAYDVTEYSRSVSARSNIRGLNRIVYVP